MEIDVPSRRVFAKRGSSFRKATAGNEPWQAELPNTHNQIIEFSLSCKVKQSNSCYAVAQARSSSLKNTLSDPESSGLASSALGQN